jgi:DNA-binding IclR family transcriptional regulator
MGRPLVKSAVRALEVLECFSRERTPLTQKQICSSLRYPQSSTTFLLKSMVEVGYICYNRQQRAYFPTPEVLKLALWLEKSDYKFLFGTSVVTEMIYGLRDRTNETVALSTQNDTHVHWHRMLASDLAAELCIPEGKMYPLTYSSHGWILLSHNPPEQIEKLVRLINWREKDRSRRIDVQAALDRAAQIREQGFVYWRNVHLPGGGSVAMLLPVMVAGRPIAIGIGGPVARIERKLDEMVAVLRETIEVFGDPIRDAFERNRALNEEPESPPCDVAVHH